MVAPILRPVNEPGPLLKSISVMSWKPLPFSCNFSWMKPSNFSAMSWPKSFS